MVNAGQSRRHLPLAVGRKILVEQPLSSVVSLLQQTVYGNASQWQGE